MRIGCTGQTLHVVGVAATGRGPCAFAQRRSVAAGGVVGASRVMSAAAMNAEERITELEIKIAFLERLVGDLATALQHETRAHAGVVDRVETLERALQVLAARVPKPRDDVANAAEDPVPSSG
jgi:uncharacterized coiled-coil protein SlyX